MSFQKQVIKKFRFTLYINKDKSMLQIKAVAIDNYENYLIRNYSNFPKIGRNVFDGTKSVWDEICVGRNLLIK